MENKVYEDSYCCSFRDAGQFMDFLKERRENSTWMTVPSRSLRLEPLRRESVADCLYMQTGGLYPVTEVLEDTFQNTGLLLSVNGREYPVRSCAVKTILERARISGHALSKVSMPVFTQIVNACMDVAGGDSLIKIADRKVSAVHGGDSRDYAVLEMLPLFEHVKEYLDAQFPGNRFLAASFDHAYATAVWSLDGQADELLETYRREVGAKKIACARTVLPALRFLTSDVGMSGANLYPILLVGGGKRTLPLGCPIRTEHKNGASITLFGDQLSLLFARFQQALHKQTELLRVEVLHPGTAMLGVLKRVGAPKKSSYEAEEAFLAAHGDGPCTAYELYLAMSDIIFLAQCDGAGGGKVAQLEEIVARALSVNWHEFDRPGAFTW